MYVSVILFNYTITYRYWLLYLIIFLIINFKFFRMHIEVIFLKIINLVFFNAQLGRYDYLKIIIFYLNFFIYT